MFSSPHCNWYEAVVPHIPMSTCTQNMNSTAAQSGNRSSILKEHMEETLSQILLAG